LGFTQGEDVYDLLLANRRRFRRDRSRPRLGRAFRRWRRQGCVACFAHRRGLRAAGSRAAPTSQWLDHARNQFGMRSDERLPDPYCWLSPQQGWGARPWCAKAFRLSEIASCGEQAWL